MKMSFGADYFYTILKPDLNTVHMCEGAIVKSKWNFLEPDDCDIKEQIEEFKESKWYYKKNYKKQAVLAVLQCGDEEDSLEIACEIFLAQDTTIHIDGSDLEVCSALIPVDKDKAVTLSGEYFKLTSDEVARVNKAFKTRYKAIFASSS